MKTTVPTRLSAVIVLAAPCAMNAPAQVFDTVINLPGDPVFGDSLPDNTLSLIHISEPTRPY